MRDLGFWAEFMDGLSQRLGEFVGPVFDEWEADVGRTYVMGSDPEKHRLCKDLPRIFDAIKQYFDDHRDVIAVDILRFWIGHADKSITDRYSKMSKRIQTRKEWAEKAGLGFNLPAFCTQCTKKAAFPLHENAA